MIAAVFAALMTAIDPASGTPPPASPPAAIVETSPIEIARDRLARAQQIYAQSCGDRAYGAYDDLCGELSTQVRNFHVELDRLERAATAKARAATPKS